MTFLQKNITTYIFDNSNKNNIKIKKFQGSGDWLPGVASEPSPPRAGRGLGPGSRDTNKTVGDVLIIN